MKKPIELGDLVKDDLTGFQGTVIAVTRWLNGCKRMVVQSGDLNKGKGGIPAEPQTFDEVQLTFVKHTPFTQALAEDPVSGGPRPDPQRW